LDILFTLGVPYSGQDRYLAPFFNNKILFETENSRDPYYKTFIVANNHCSGVK
jgi:hypothetical protein